jgi:hypothetical protein
MSNTNHTSMPPSLHRADALSAALHRFCQAARDGYAAGAQAARDEILLRMPLSSIEAAKAAIMDYQLIYMESVEAQRAAFSSGHWEGAVTASANLAQVVIRLARMEMEPK